MPAITQRVLQGARLIVIDPRRTELAALADVHLQARPGSNVAVFHALARNYLSSELGRVETGHDSALIERTLVRAALTFGSGGWLPRQPTVKQ